jgi:flagellar biosynthesis anti-sigma factor FlgM
MDPVNPSGKNAVTGDAENLRVRQTGKLKPGVSTTTEAIGSGDSAVVPGGDVISVSERGEIVRRLVERASEEPEVREDRVERLRDVVQSGHYYPDSGQIADALLRDELIR